MAASGSPPSSPALADLDSDGQLEVVIGSQDQTVRAWNSDGSPLWTRTPTFAHLGTGPVLGSPVVADLDGDGDQDVAVGTALGLALLDGRTGADLEAGLEWWDRMNFVWSHDSAPAVGMLGGERRLVVSGFSIPLGTTRVAAYELPPSSADDHWPMFRHSPTREGRTHNWTTPRCGPSTARPFCDVVASAYYEPATQWMVDRGMTSGISPTVFGPDLVLTRGQMVTFMWRQAGSPSGYRSHGFVDVPPDAFFDDAVAWAKAESVTAGTSAVTFSPNDAVTRGQLVTLMWRRADRPGGYPHHGFVDVAPGSYYADAIAWAKAEGVTTGTGPFTFAPEQPVSRAQAAALRYREAGSPAA